MQVDLDELEAKFADALHGPTCDELYRIAPSMIAELREARKTIAGTCHQVVSLSADKRKLEAEIGELRVEVKTFLVLWAARYSEMQGLGGAFHPQHFDRLKELGARMDDFKRADLQPAKETPVQQAPGRKPNRCNYHSNELVSECLLTRCNRLGYCPYAGAQP